MFSADQKLSTQSSSVSIFGSINGPAQSAATPLLSVHQSEIGVPPGGVVVPDSKGTPPSQPLFSYDFIDTASGLFESNSKKAGQMSGFLNPTETNAILDYMRALQIQKGGVVIGEDGKDVAGLLNLITTTKQNFKPKSREPGVQHPFEDALDIIQYAIEANLTSAQPKFIKNLRKAHEDYATKKQARSKELDKLTSKQCGWGFGIMGCAIWGVVQQPLTLFNCFRVVATRPSNISACADDPENSVCAPVELKKGEVSGCDAVASIKSMNAMIEDLESQKNALTPPPAPAMKRL